jgi:hypothetical protein
MLAQAPAAHRYGAHGVVVALHWPPEHWPASFRTAELWQEAGEQVVPSAYFWQPPPPSHLPFVPQVVGSWATQVPFGSTAPAIMGEHVPSLPWTLQALHDGQLGDPQHTLSTQLPLPHWLPVVQA